MQLAPAVDYKYKLALIIAPASCSKVVVVCGADTAELLCLTRTGVGCGFVWDHNSTPRSPNVYSSFVITRYPVADRIVILMLDSGPHHLLN